MRKSSRMAPKEKQTIEIEKTDRDPLPSFNQAVTVDCSDFLGTALALPKKLELFSGCGGGCGMGEGRCRQVHRCHIHREQDDSCNSLGSRRSDQGQHQTDRSSEE